MSLDSWCKYRTHVTKVVMGMKVRVISDEGGVIEYLGDTEPIGLNVIKH
jgi:hypothetical protein